MPSSAHDLTTRSLVLGLITASVLGAGTASAGTASAAVDRTPPSASVSFEEQANPGAQAASGSTVFYNPARTGQFVVRVAAGDRESGITSVTFPGAWSTRPWVDTTAPYTGSYTWATGSPSTGPLTVLVTNGAGLTTPLTIAARADAVPPAAGAALSHPTGRTAATSVTVTATAGPGDPGGSGMATRVLQRRSDLSGACARFDVTDLAAAPPTPYVDLGLPPGSCHRYRLVETDAVGNTRTTEGPATPVRVNAAPSVDPLALATAEDTALPLTLQGRDAEGDVLDWEVTSPPGRGTLTGTAPALVYTPHQDLSGHDSFVVTAGDGLATSAPTRITVEVGAVDDPPTSRAASVSLDEDTSAAVVLHGEDAEGDALTYQVVDGPEHGALTGSGAHLVYTPAADFAGEDSLTYRVGAGGAWSAPARVRLLVAPVNDAPVAQPAGAGTEAGRPVALGLAGTDPDSDVLSVVVLTPPAHGQVSGTDGGHTYTYTPEPGFVGADSLRYAVSDGRLTSAPVTVRVTVSRGEPLPLSFTPSGMDGAGFQNVVAVDPRGTGLVLAGADVSGVHRSTDWGRTFVASNVGVAGQSQLFVAALAFSPSAPGTVFAGVGYRGGGGGVLVSTDEGRSWALRSRTPQFSGGNNETPGLPDRHPRSTGELFAFDQARGIVYAATFDQGVMRSADEGRTWTPIGLAGEHLRSLVIDPTDPDTLYAAAYGTGVHRAGTASGTPTWTRLAASPARTEEIVAVGRTLYAAGGPDGAFRSTDRGATWTQLGAGVVRSDGPVWLAVDAHRDARTGQDVVVVGSDAPARGTAPGAFDSLMASRDGGRTWASLTGDASAVHPEVGGPDGDPWWLLGRQGTMALGRGSYTASHIVTAGSRIFVAGRSGIWASSDDGREWYPMVRGLGVTINKQVVADPHTPGRIYVSNTDWVTLYSTDGGRTVVQNRPPTGTMGTALALDTAVTPSVVYSAVGERDSNTHGEVYANPDPAAGGRWTSLELGEVTGGKRVLALAVRRVAGSPVVLAAVEGGGVWRRAAGTWTQVSTAALASDDKGFASMAWTPDRLVWLHDARSGLWRSADDGVTWTPVWRKPSTSTSTSTVAADPTQAGRVYVSMPGDGVYRLDDAQTGTVGAGITPVRLAGVNRAGALATSSTGQLYATDSTAGHGVLRASSDEGTTWRTVGDATYASTANFPFAIALGPGGDAYLALNGNGVLRGSTAR